MGDECLTCGARARSVVTWEGIRTRHEQKAVVGIVGVAASGYAKIWWRRGPSGGGNGSVPIADKGTQERGKDPVGRRFLGACCRDLDPRNPQDFSWGPDVKASRRRHVVVSRERVPYICGNRRSHPVVGGSGEEIPWPGE